MKGLADINLFEMTEEKSFTGKTYAQFIASLIHEESADNILSKTAHFLNVKSNSDLINNMAWLGLFSRKNVAICRGANGDVLVDLMVKKMSYGADEKDMVIVHVECMAEFSDRRERRVATLLVKGDPQGDSAMSRAVSLPAAIASKLILEGKITIQGVHRPTFSDIYQPVLREMAQFGYNFTYNTTKL